MGMGSGMGLAPRRTLGRSRPWRRLRRTDAASSSCRGSGGGCPAQGIRPGDGRSATVPVNAAGMRKLPPMSAPSARAQNPDRTATAEPPEEPPGVRRRSYGLFVTPYMSENVCTSSDLVGTAVFPKMRAPARRKRATTSASSRRGLLNNEPAGDRASSALASVVGIPCTSIGSFTKTGTPLSGREGSTASARRRV